jgi:aminoglycoside phosphotransferase (APT) family kinase protein
MASARVLRRFHDATAGSELAGEHEIVCHNDPSPCNFVFVAERPVALIDFDHAAPGDRLRDVAYAGSLWTLSADDGPPVGEQARRLRLMAESYGLSDTRALVDAVLTRQEENRDAALARSRSADPAVAEYGRVSAEWQGEQMRWLRSHAREFRACWTSSTAAGRVARRRVRWWTCRTTM